MYTPEIYKDEDPESIKAFLRENSFGILINQTNGKLCATHIPIELEVNTDGKEILQGHISKLNPQAEGFTENDQVVIVHIKVLVHIAHELGDTFLVGKT